MFTTELIKKAWKIRREAAVKFNCGIMEISWKECLAMAKEGKQKLSVEEVANLWEKYGKSRYYFDKDKLIDALGYEYQRYNTGNLSSATLNGKKISNTEMKEVFDRFDGLYFDNSDNVIKSRFSNEEVSDEISTAINSVINFK